MSIPYERLSDDDSQYGMTELRRRTIETQTAESSQKEYGPEAAVDDDCEMVYGLEDVPPWHICLLLGLQHFLMMAPGTIAAPVLLFGPLCMLKEDAARGYLVATIFFVCGIVTIFQSTLGSRLPIVQGPTFAVMVTVLAVLDQPEWKCLEEAVLRNMTETERDEEWKSRIRSISGAITVASVLEVILGLTGLVGFLLRWITPLAIAPTITMIGIALTDTTADIAGKHWGLSGLCVVLVIVFSQYMRNIKVPIPYSQDKSGKSLRLPIFSLFPVLISILLAWLLCYILTATDTLEKGHTARTDGNLDLLHRTDWLFFPYPGQWGSPTVDTGAVIGVLAGILASTIESVGDYYACARLVGTPPPPSHAINRGIMFEGIGSVLAGLYGTCSGTTSYSQNIAAIGITKVGSRRVLQVAAVFMLLCGMIGKFGALFVTVPDPIIGGMFISLFGMVAAVGISILQYVDMNSPRNLFILGLSIFLSMVSNVYLTNHPDAIQTGSQVADTILTILLKTTMFFAGFIGFFLDNTVPGTDEERGLTKWRPKEDKDNSDSRESYKGYDLPFTSFLWRYSWTKNLPFSPTYKF